MKTQLKEYIEQELKQMKKSIIATPEDRDYLEAFAKANHGSMDFLLMQMSMNYGYKIALENVIEQLENN
jgi:hypothetical protein